MGEAAQTPKSLKAQITRTSLVLAAAALLREQGPSAVTYRKVAKWAGAASSSVGYYFESASQLLYEAGRYNIQLWSDRAEKAAVIAEKLEADECRAKVVDLLMQAVLPDKRIVPAAHYAQLIASAESQFVTEAYRRGRVTLDEAVEGILKRARVPMPPRLVSVTVDGAAVAALSEGYDVREFAAGVLAEALQAYGWEPPAKDLP